MKILFNLKTGTLALATLETIEESESASCAQNEVKVNIM